MKKILFILVCSFMIFNLTGCGNKYKGQGTEPLKEHGDVALHIDSGNKGNCVKVTLVLYEDNHLIVIEKPVNVLSQKDNTNDIDITEIVKEYLKNKYNKPGNVYLGLVHRLDRRVGGVLVLAKTSKAAARLSDDIRNRKFEKE